MKKYSLIDHTADVGLEIYGRSIEEFFLNGAAGLSYLLAENIHPIKAYKKSINLNCNDLDQLFINWMSELLFFYDTMDFYSQNITIFKISENELKAEVLGQIINKSRSSLKYDIKAVTFHDFSIVENNNIYEARLIFDI